MDDRSRDRFAALIEAVSRQTPSESRRLASRLVGGCWPGGGDRSERAALDWVRRWGPSPSGASLPSCSCAAGRCAVCN